MNHTFTTEQLEKLTAACGKRWHSALQAIYTGLLSLTPGAGRRAPLIGGQKKLYYISASSSSEAALQQPDQLNLRPGRDLLDATGHRQRGGGAGARAIPRQRRPGPAGRMFPGLHRNPRFKQGTRRGP